MAQEFANIQHQEQSMEQQQRLTTRQVAYMRMLEMPLEDLREKIERELEENVALEREDTPAEQPEAPDEEVQADDTMPVGTDDTAIESFDQDTLDEIEYFESERPSRRLQGGDDEYTLDDPSAPLFRDTLMQQAGEYTLTPHQRELLDYLIGSLDDDGLLKKKLYVIADELEIYMNIQATTGELEEMLRVLQQFDPPGIGAQSLQETLLLQIDSRIEERPDSILWPLLRQVVDTQWDHLTGNRWDLIRKELQISEGEARSLQRMLRTLTPSPGLPPGEAVTTQGANTSIVPDVVVEVAVDGTITVQLNEPGIPTLRVSPQYEAMARLPISGSPGRSNEERRSSQEYLRSSVMRANSFIINVRNRHNTILRIMRELVTAQRDYFLTGDESQIHPLMMKEIGERIGLDISIVSRVVSNKWVETPYGMRPVRWFFRGTGGVTRDDGTQLEQDKLVQLVGDTIAAEDKRHPLTDDKLAKLLTAKGYPLARRTVAKYREMLGIPVARMRQQR